MGGVFFGAIIGFRHIKSCLNNQISSKLMFKTASTILLLLMSNAAHSSPGGNPFAEECNTLASLDRGSLVFENPPENSFWAGDADMGDVYLENLSKDSDTHDSEPATYGSASLDSAAVLAAIVKHRLPLLKEHFNAGVVEYFDQTQQDLLGTAASCDFESGIQFLLSQGLDPNSGHGVGAFNIALLNQNSPLAEQLINNGYQINHNQRRCFASKFIVRKNGSKIPQELSETVFDTDCSESLSK